MPDADSTPPHDPGRPRSDRDAPSTGDGSIPRDALGSRPSSLDSIDVERTRVAAAKALFGRTLPPVRVDRFELRTPLGRGSMGRVFSAWDPRLRRTVALKLVSAEPDAAGRARWLAEARALATVEHPNVVDVFEVGTWGADVFLAMERVDGTSLRRWLGASTREPAQILGVFAQVAEGLGAIHRAGLVHRDVKPDNVMIDAEGRARVVDLGLARAPQGGEPTVPATSESPSSTTSPGRTAGTPAYMAPEQRHGEFGPASDQYSLCIALVEALTGSRPRPALETTATMPRIGPIPGVSARCRRAIARGLTPDPARRFATMDALADALTQTLRPRPRPHRTAGWLALAGIITAGALWAWPSTTPPPSCQGAAQIEPVWNSERDAIIEARLSEAAPSFGTEAGRAATDALDDYTRAWVAAYDATCAEPTGSAADSIRDCLHARLAALREAVDLLHSGDASVLPRAPKIVAELPAIASCTAADRAPPLPHDPQQARRIEALRRRLPKIGVLLEAGEFERAEAIATEVLQEARALDYAPLEAEALERLGATLDRAGDSERATSTFEAGYLAAQAAGGDEAAARCAVGLVSVAVDRATFEQADTWARHARSLLDRLRGEPLLEADLHRALGFLERRRANAAAAIAHHERTQQIEQQALPPRAYRHGVTWTNLAAAQESAGRRDEARRSYAHALEIFEARYGPRHPAVAAVRANLAAAALEAGYIEEAAAGFTTSLEDFTAAYGPEHPSVLLVLVNLGQVNLKRLRWDEAQAQLERALRARERQLGSEHPDLVSPLMGLARIADVFGQTQRALEYMERGLRIREATLGEQHPAVAEVLGNMTSLLLGAERNAEALPLAARAVEIAARSEWLGPLVHASLLDRYAVALARNDRWDEARERHREAREQLAALGNPTHPMFADFALHEAEGLTRQGDHAAAIERLDDALARSAEGSPTRQQVRFSLANALWDHTDQHERARALARDALAALRAEDVVPGLQAEIEQWLARHGPEADPG